MPFRLEFADKYELWSELLHSNTERVFVPSEGSCLLGSSLPVELSLKGTAVRVVLVGTVVGIRHAGGRFPRGFFLRFDPQEVEKCRRFLGLSVPTACDKGRKQPRARCSLQMSFVSHPETHRFEVRNLSESGLLGTAPASIRDGERVKLLLTLDDGQNVPLEAEVSWVRTQDRLVGLRFVDPPVASRRQVAECVQRLLESDAARARPSRPTMIVAEDDPDILAFLVAALSRHGYQVQVARRGDEALALIREFSPQMVLMDILMPGIDGVDICKLMRSDVELADIPVVFLSALEEARLHAMAHDAGATDYLCKPVNLADLLNVVGRYLKRAA